MKRNEKIEKLERLGIFNQWKYNTERANETFNIECPDFSMTNEERMNNLLDVDCSFHQFLTISFLFIILLKVLLFGRILQKNNRT